MTASVGQKRRLTASAIPRLFILHPFRVFEEQNTCVGELLAGTRLLLPSVRFAIQRFGVLERAKSRFESQAAENRPTSKIGARETA
jgi:hypothetical protein